MRFFTIFLLLITTMYSADTQNSTEQHKPKIYTLNEYKKVKSADLKKYANDDDMYWGIKLHDLALLSSTKLNLKLGKDYDRKSIIAVHESESNDSLESLIKGDYFFYWDGVSECQSSPNEVVFYKNRALVSYYGKDDSGVWVTIKLIVKSKKQFDIYILHGWTGDIAPIEPVNNKPLSSDFKIDSF